MLTAEQRALRMQGMGASDVAAAIGLGGRWRPIDVWQEKTRFGMGSGTEADSAEEEDEEEDDLREDRERGIFLEPGIRDWYAHRERRQVTLSGTLVHPEDPRILATPDGIAGPSPEDKDTLLVEIKAPRGIAARDWGRAKTDQIPDKFLVQVTWAMAVTALPKAHLVALVKDELRVYHIPYAAELFAELRAAAMEFWETYVVAGVEPPIDGSQAYAQYIGAKYGWVREAAEVFKAKRDEAQWVRKYQEYRWLAKQAEERKQQSASHIKNIMGERGLMESRYGRVSWSQKAEQKRVNWEALARSLGATEAQIEAHTRVKAGGRMLTVPAIQDDILARMEGKGRLGRGAT